MSAPLQAGRARAIASAVAGAVATALLAWGAWHGFTLVAGQPVGRVLVTDPTRKVPSKDIEAFSTAIIGSRALSLESIRARALRLPWVREATVRRLQPDTLEVVVSTHAALARWNEGELVSTRGEVFSAPEPGELPRLRGPATLAAQVAHEYRLATAALAPLGSPVTEFALSERGAWRATLGSGLRLALGRGDWRPRAERFVRAWPKLSAEAQASDYADLRYPGGFALKRTAKLTLPPGRGTR